MLISSFTALFSLGVAGALARPVTVTTPQQGDFVGHSLDFGDQVSTSLAQV